MTDASHILRRPSLILTTLVVLVLLACPVSAAPQPSFASPDEAVSALVKSLQSEDRAAVATLLGPGSAVVVRSGDPVKDRQEADRFLSAYAAHHAIAAEGPDRAVLQVGADDWSLPIPLVMRDGAWRFDARAGAQEIIDRRIGRNELAAVRFCLAYVDAQRAYFDMFARATGTGTFARRLVSTEGNYDGLYWPSVEGAPESPLAPLMASAVEEGYAGQPSAAKPTPYQGYYYRILTAQGRHAPGGAKNYVRNGKLLDGFALIAWPAGYGTSGIMTFVINQDGIVFQKDFGPQTSMAATKVSTFDPGLDWTRVEIASP